MAKTNKRLYLIPVLSKALDILELFQADNQPMNLEQVHRRTKISKTTVYRILKTFVHRGYLAQSSDATYRRVTRPRKLRFGFAGQSVDMPFSNDVTRSLQQAAADFGVDLLVLDNRYDAETAVRNAEEFVANGVDLVIEMQTEQEVASIIGDKIAAARIPLIAVDIPHPHATYFGVDNYRVGSEAGAELARYAQREWGGTADWVIGLDLPEAGPFVQGRISGAFEAIRTAIPELPVEAFVRIDGRGMRDKSRKAVGAFLERHPKDKRILIAAVNDTSALGAIDAAIERKRERHIAVVGQDCIEEAVSEMNRKNSPLIGSVSHETSSYGPSLMTLGLQLLRGQTVPPYNYVTHKLLTRASQAEPVRIEAVKSRRSRTAAEA